MKGLLIKDFLQLRQYKKSIIISLIFVICMSFVYAEDGDVISVIAVINTLMFSIMATSTFAYDELSKADKYILSLPVTKRDVVIAKYIFSICCVIIGFIFGFILGTVLTILINGKIISLDAEISSILGGTLFAIFMQCMQIPCIIKYGVEKGRLYSLIYMALVAAVIFGGFLLLNKVGIVFNPDVIFSKINNFIPLIVLGLYVVMYLISYKISSSFYSKKEF